jgi:phage-related protein
MANFPSITPTYGAAKTSTPNLRQVQFGDGYTQVLRFGLNQNPKQWILRWEVSETDADTIETFLDARADDGATFSWTPPASSTSYKWRCFAWSKSIPFTNRATVKATFIQYFEP